MSPTMSKLLETMANIIKEDDLDRQEVGHVNASIGLAEVLRRRGHNIIFAIDPPFKGMLIKYGFEEQVLNAPADNLEERRPGEEDGGLLIESGIFSHYSQIDKMKLLIRSGFVANMVNRLPIIEPQFQSLLDKHNTDVIIIDHFVTSPNIIYSGKPWVFVWSGCPIIIEDKMTPPLGSGYPTNSDKNLWIEIKQLGEKLFSSDVYNAYLKANGYSNNANNLTMSFSPFLNIYNYPKELDYTDIRPVPDKWFGVDTLIRSGERPFELPAQLKERNGRLIYLSLGSMGSVDTELMKRLVKILSKSKHKFIVSNGLFGDKYELADNMWGQKSVPQTKVLPLVDLVLTHGGNNTVTETLYFGKPMIILPLYGDQFDNAQRVQEKGFGIRIDPYLCSEDELLNSIEMLLNDNELNEKLILASNRIQNSESLERVTEKIETLAN